MTQSPPPRLYGRRKGRPLRARKTRLVEELLPQLRIMLPEKLIPGTSFLDATALFPFEARSIWLEIGFGGGEHLAAQARQNPSFGFVGCEPFVNGVAGLLDHIDRDAINNIRIFPNDARLLLDALPDNMIERCFVLFPDPWPKARHTDRRFLNVETSAKLARVMRSGAELRLASDDPGMISWFREIMNAAKDFRRESDSPEPPPDWVPTRYEQKAIKAGRQPAHMIYRRL